MQKNVAGQRWVVFAFNRTTNVPETGDAAQITANIYKDGGAPGPVADTNPVELEGGYYMFAISQVECNADLLTLTPESTTGNIQVIGVPGTIYTTAPGSNSLIDGKTPAEALEIIAAGAAGDLSGAGTGTEVVKGLDNVTTRATATIDAVGNRVVVY